MIPVLEERKRTGNLEGDEIAFGISEKDTGWIMESLSDLYANREGATIRELATNARDAHLEAGVDEPILITKPSAFSPEFVVQDFGPGMSREVLTSVYTQYGYSTKRDSNDFNGLLGFGSKAPAAYTDSFTVDSRHEGRRVVAVITRNEKNALVMKIVSDGPTSERNGVKITVPVHNSVEFASKVDDFFKFWDKGTVLVNGVEPDNYVGDRIAEGLYHVEQPRGNVYYREPDSYVVMGGVAYRIQNAHALFKNTSQFSFVAFLENGAVDFTPSREDLKYTPRTKARLHKIIDDFVAESMDNYKAELKSAKTHYEAYAIYRKWRELLGRHSIGTLEFKGDEFSDKTGYKVDVYNPNASRYAMTNDSYLYVSHVEDARANYYGGNTDTLVVKNFTASQVSSNHRNQVKEYANINGLNLFRVYFCDEDFENKWINPDKIIDWSDLRASLPKSPRKPRGQGRQRPKYWFPAFYEGVYMDEYTVPDSGTIVYCHSSEKGPYEFGTITSLKAFAGQHVLVVGSHRLNKFRREIPDAIHWKEFAKSKVVKDAKSLLDHDQRVYLANKGSNVLTLLAKGLSDTQIDKIESQEIARTVRSMKKAWPTKDYAQNETLAAYGNVTLDKPDVRSYAVDVANRYPLLNTGMSWYYSDKDSVVEYINAIDNYRKDN